MNTRQLVEFVRQRGLAVVATRNQEGAPQAALVGIAATHRAELIFDTSVHSRKYLNLRVFPRVAVVVGWYEEVTLQIEGDADILAGAERDRCLRAYVEQYPDGSQRSEDPEIVLVRVRVSWGRLNDYRPGSSGTEAVELIDN